MRRRDVKRDRFLRDSDYTYLNDAEPFMDKLKALCNTFEILREQERWLDAASIALDISTVSYKIEKLLNDYNANYSKSRRTQKARPGRGVQDLWDLLTGLEIDYFESGQLHDLQVTMQDALAETNDSELAVMLEQAFRAPLDTERDALSMDRLLDEITDQIERYYDV